MTSTHIRALHVALAALSVIVLDQLSKWYLLAIVALPARPPIEITGFFRLVMVWNRGVSFGLFNQHGDYMPWFLMALALAIAAVLARLALKSAYATERTAYALVIGGALGNVIDRLRFGAVADFFYFHLGALGWPAFNLADACICVGVIGLLLMMLKHPAKP